MQGFTNCECKQCHIKFRIKPSAIKRNRGQFCSRKCRSLWQSQNIRGIFHPFYGKKHSEKAKLLNRKKHMGENNPNFGKQRPLHVRENVREKIKQSNLEAYSRSETWHNWLKGTARRPTTPEKFLISIIDANNIPLQYVGDGILNIGNMCPDFIANNGFKSVVEVFGDYWHSPEEAVERAASFQKHGYDCLILWEHELKDKNLLQKLRSFLNA